MTWKPTVRTAECLSRTSKDRREFLQLTLLVGYECYRTECTKNVQRCVLFGDFCTSRNMHNCSSAIGPHWKWEFMRNLTPFESIHQHTPTPCPHQVKMQELLQKMFLGRKVPVHPHKPDDSACQWHDRHWWVCLWRFGAAGGSQEGQAQSQAPWRFATSDLHLPQRPHASPGVEVSW